MIEYKRGTTAYTEINLYDDFDNPADPTSVTVTITDSNGTKLVDAETATKDTTGIYYHKYTLPSSLIVNTVCKVVITVTTGTDISIIEREFAIKD